LKGIAFTNDTGRNFPVRNEEAMKKLKEKLLIPTYPNDEELTYTLKRYARIFAGCIQDKRWTINVGERDCGKGVFTYLLKKAFGFFVGEFSANTFLNKTNIQDTEKDLAWCVPLHRKRMLISNEMKADGKETIDGIKVKMFASGGDFIPMRGLYQEPKPRQPQFSLIFMANKVPKVEPADALTNCDILSYKSQFVDDASLIEKNKFFRLKDNDLKETLLEDPLIIDAYTLAILDAFELTPPAIPECIKFSSVNERAEQIVIPSFFIASNFKHTDNIEDCLSTDRIIDILTNADIKNTTPQSVASYLGKFKIGVKSSKLPADENGKRKRGYTNIIFTGKDDPDADSEDEDEVKKRS
jgi:hypothetical protein